MGYVKQNCSRDRRWELRLDLAVWLGERGNRRSIQSKWELSVCLFDGILPISDQQGRDGRVAEVALQRLVM